MHLAVDAIGIKHSGGAAVLSGFLGAALENPRVTRVTVFCSPASERGFILPVSPKLQSIEQPLAERSYLARILWFQVVLGYKCMKISADVLICMVGCGRVRSRPSCVTFIQQSLPFSREALECYGIGKRLQLIILKELMRSSCTEAKLILVQTPTMKRCVSEQFKIPNDKIDVVLPGVNYERNSPAGKMVGRTNQGVDSIILYVGNDGPYKNIKTILEGMTLLRKMVPGVTLQGTWPADHPYCKHSGVKSLGFLPPDRLVEIYQRATILVMPSLVETVGLPMLEAMSIGVPVLAADRPYAHDVCEDAALYFDPLASEDFARKAHYLLSNDELRRRLIEKGKMLMGRRMQEAPYARMVDMVLESASS